MTRLRRSLVQAVVAAGVLVAAVAASPAVQAAGPGVTPAAWSSAQRVFKKESDELSAVVDSSGHLHIAVSGAGNVYYVTDRTGSWTHRLVMAGTGSFTYGQPSIALDENNRVHIAATRFPNGEGDEGIWYSSDIGRTRGTFPSGPTRIAPTGNGEPVLKASNGHLWLVDVSGWCCVGDGTVQLRTNVSGSWTVSTIGRGQEPSFRLGTDHRAQVAYQRGDTALGIYYARAATTSGGFSTARIAGTNAHDNSPVLALSANNKPWVAWTHFKGSLSVLVDHRTSSGWGTPDPAISGISGENLFGFDLDTLGRPNVAYGDVSVHALLRSGGSWHSTTVAAPASPGMIVMRRALNGHVALVWSDNSGGGTFVARN